jgi:hypothetical protein
VRAGVAAAMAFTNIDFASTIENDILGQICVEGVMTLVDVISAARYIVDSNGEKTEVVLPIETWEKLLATRRTAPFFVSGWNDVRPVQPRQSHSTNWSGR